MMTKVAKARVEWVCARCGRVIKKGEKYIKILSPFQRSIGMEAICWDCATPEERGEGVKPILDLKSRVEVDITVEIVTDNVDKQHYLTVDIEKIKSACDFYIRYKDYPELLINEQKELLTVTGKLEEAKAFAELIQCLEGSNSLRQQLKYNEWLFRLAFRGVLGGDK